MAKATNTEEPKAMAVVETPTDTSMMARPAYAVAGDLRGTEDITKDDIQMPRLALAQQMSPELNPGEAKFIKGLGVMDLFNDLTQQIYGRGPIEFTVIKAFPPRWIEFIPREEGGGVKDLNVPANDPRTQWRTDPETGKGLPPVATKFYDYVIMLLPSRELVALSLKSSGLKVARQLNGLIKYRNAPSFMGKYAVTTAMDKNALGTFAVYQIRNAGWVTEEEFHYAGAIYDSLQNKTIVIDREPGSDDDIEFPAGSVASM